MKFIRIRYIVPSLLAIVLLVALGLYFIGGLKARAIDFDTLPFDASVFSDLDEENLLDERKVAQNDKYTMFINEKTTVVRVVVNSTCSNINDSSTCEAVYQSALDESDYSEQKSNLILRYFDSDGKPNETGYNSYEYSVSYYDKVQGITVPHYKLNYTDSGVDILYEIGNFNNERSLFPSNFDRNTYDDLFRGNLQFYTRNSTRLTEVGGITTNAYLLQYTGFGATYNAECAAYLEENGLATVTEATDTRGNFLGRWDLSNIAVSDRGALTDITLGVDYNSTTSPCTSNPFSNSSVISSIYSPQSYSLSQTGSDTSVTLITDTSQYVENSSYILRFNYNISSILYRKMYSYLYDVTKATNQIVVNSTGTEELSPTGNYLVNSNRPVYYDYNNDGEISIDELVQVGGYQARDEDGNWLYDEDGNPVQIGFTKDQAEEQNEIFGNTSDSVSAAFQVCLRFELFDEGLKVYVLNESLIEGEGSKASSDMYAHDFKIYEIQVVPYLTTNQDINSTGQIVLPDGSGAVISFNSVKDAQNSRTYSKSIYGVDYTLPQESMSQMMTKWLMFGMYGFLDVSAKKGVVAIVEKGAAQSSIQADFMRAAQTTTFNYARFTTSLRVRESVSVSSGSSFNKWSVDLYQDDIIYSYRFLDEDELDYVGVANKYREYLIDKYDLDENGDKTTEHTVSIMFLGAFEKKKLTMGIVHDADFSLTTFKQALEIVNELNLAGVENFNVLYDGWTNYGYGEEATRYAKAASVLGGKKDLMELAEYLKSKAYNFYPRITVSSFHGFDYPYGNMKYSPKTVGSTYSTVAEFVVSTGMADSYGGMISPRFYYAYLTNYLKSYNKFDIEGGFLETMGSFKTGDYAKKVQIYAETGIRYQQEALQLANDTLINVSAFAPFDYAFKYVDLGINAPLVTTLYPSVDYSIPLYQLVASGLFDYTTPDVNIDTSNSPEWYFLKALETGSNLSFTISAEDTKILLDTNHTNFYNAYYMNWKQRIISLNSRLNSVGIYKSRLVSHKYIADNVVEVGYENGLTIIINYDNSTYQDPVTGLAVRGNWYMIVEEGK